jgi:hypothetical protein
MAIRVDKADAVAHQATGQDVLAIWVADRNRMARRQRNQLCTADNEERIGRDE